MRRSSLTLIVLSALLLAGAESSFAAKTAEEEAAEMAAFKDAMVVKDKNAKVVDRETLPGADHYRRYCAVCHEGQVQKAPSKTFLEMMPADAIYAALTDGIMRQKAKKLATEETVDGSPPPAPERSGTPPRTSCSTCASRSRTAGLRSRTRSRRTSRRTWADERSGHARELMRARSCARGPAPGRPAACHAGMYWCTTSRRQPWHM